MTIVVSDLLAKLRAEGAQETQQQIKAVGEAATQTARALELMAQAAAKQSGGTAQGWLEIFQRSNVQPTAAAMADAAKSMQQTAAAATQAVAPTSAVARAADDLQKGFSLSNTQIVRMGAGLLGIGLGINVLAGAARLVHGAILDIVDAQTNWERSLVQVHALYGALGQRVVDVSRAQAALPGVLGTQQEFLQANLQARYLASRFGLPQADIYQLTTAAGRVAGTLGITDERQRQQMQAAFLQFAEGGGTGLRQYGVEGDPESIARRLGFPSGAALQALTPQALRQAQSLMAIQGANQLAIRGNEQQRGLLQARTGIERALEQARTNLQNALEGGGAAQLPAPGPTAGYVGVGPVPGTREFYARQGALIAGEAVPPAQATGLLAEQTQQRMDELRRAVEEQQAALEANSRELGDAEKAAADAADQLNKLGVEAGGATARLLTFEGSLEDVTSIARGDIAAQAQAAVAARGVSAVPLIGRPTAEIGFQARNTAYQQAWQNYVATLAQSTGDNAIRANLERLATMQGPGLEAQRGAAQRALEQAGQTEPVQRRMGQAQVREAQVNLATAETQARLEAITLTQRERYVQLMRDTVDLRRLDVQQQQIGIQATMEVIRAQQAALPAQRITSAAQYQQNLAQALSQQRMARLLQGQDVSGLPSLDELINMNVQGQLIAAENAPSLVRGARGVEVAQQGATAAGLAQALTAGQLRTEELKVDLANLGDLPTQTALELELVQNNRDQLSVQTELREYLKQLVWIMTNQPPQPVPADRADRIGAASAAPPAPSDLPGARHQ